MQHLNPYQFYELASKLYALFAGSGAPCAGAMFGPLTEAQTLLDSWIKGDVYPLDTSKADAVRLLNKIGSLFNKYYIDPSSKTIRVQAGEDLRIDSHELAHLQALTEKFEHAFAAEMTHAPSYYATKRGIYSTYDLIERASDCFGGAMRDYIPDAAMREFDVAGRSLAFGLGTAAGVHLLRAIELVLKGYYELFSGTLVSKNERSYSIYLKKLHTLSEDENNACRPDKRLLQMLAQIKEHYRNPLTSPDYSISLEQATSLFALATAAITLMTEQMMAKEDSMTKPSGKPVIKESSIKGQEIEQTDAA